MSPATVFLFIKLSYSLWIETGLWFVIVDQLFLCTFFMILCCKTLCRNLVGAVISFENASSRAMFVLVSCLVQYFYLT